MGRIGCVVGAAFSTLLSQRSLTIRAAQASSFVFGPAGIVLEKATPQLRSYGQSVHAFIGRLVDLCFGRIHQWARRGNLTWGHVSTAPCVEGGRLFGARRRARGPSRRPSRTLGAGDGN